MGHWRPDQKKKKIIRPREAKEGQVHLSSVTSDTVQSDYHKDRNRKFPKGQSPITPSNMLQRRSPIEQVIRSKGGVTIKPSDFSTPVSDW